MTASKEVSHSAAHYRCWVAANHAGVESPAFSDHTTCDFLWCSRRTTRRFERILVQDSSGRWAHYRLPQSSGALARQKWRLPALGTGGWVAGGICLLAPRHMR